jgi:hypothetical protein
MRRKIAPLESIHLDVFTRDVDDRRVVCLAQIEPACRLCENLAAEAHPKSDSIVVELDPMLGMLCVCTGKGHQDLLEPKSSQRASEMRLKHVLFSA